MVIVAQRYYNTDKNVLEDSYLLVKDFPDFPLWEYRIASLAIAFN